MQLKFLHLLALGALLTNLAAMPQPDAEAGPEPDALAENAELVRRDCKPLKSSQCRAATSKSGIYCATAKRFKALTGTSVSVSAAAATTGIMPTS